MANKAVSILIFFFVFTTIIFCVLPLVIIIPLAFSGIKYPTFPPPSFSFQWFHSFLFEQQWMEGTLNSFLVAFCVAILSIVLGITYSYCSFQIKNKFLIAFDYISLLPIITPVMVLAIGLYNMMGEGGLGKLIISHTILGLPIIILTTSSSLRQIDPNLACASYTLGRGKFATFFLITLPQLKRTIIFGALFVFIISWDELIIALFVTDPLTPTLPKLMWDSIRREVDLTVSAVATFVAVINTIFILIIFKMKKNAHD